MLKQIGCCPQQPRGRALAQTSACVVTILRTSSTLLPELRKADVSFNKMHVYMQLLADATVHGRGYVVDTRVRSVCV